MFDVLTSLQALRRTVIVVSTMDLAGFQVVMVEWRGLLRRERKGKVRKNLTLCQCTHARGETRYQGPANAGEGIFRNFVCAT